MPRGVVVCDRRSGVRAHTIHPGASSRVSHHSSPPLSPLLRLSSVNTPTTLHSGSSPCVAQLRGKDPRSSFAHPAETPGACANPLRPRSSNSAGLAGASRSWLGSIHRCFVPSTRRPLPPSPSSSSTNNGASAPSRRPRRKEEAQAHPPQLRRMPTHKVKVFVNPQAHQWRFRPRVGRLGLGPPCTDVRH
jgi:hypothetical protein